MPDWMYDGRPLLEAPPDAFGFVYRITNLATGAAYIGKKQFWSNLSKKVAGRKNRKHYRKESDWRKYWGSCAELKEDVAAAGADRFLREILRICMTKGELTYSEVEFQIKADVLSVKLPDGSPGFYNGNILNRWFKR